MAQSRAAGSQRKIPTVTGLVRTHGFDPHPRVQRFHRGHWLQGDLRLRFGHRILDLELRRRAVPVVRQHVPAQTQPGVLALRLLVQLTVRIGLLRWVA